MKNISGFISTKTLILLCISFLLITCKKESEDTPAPVSSNNTVTDIDGNLYHTVTIGTQVWMVENLKTTRYNDGTQIPLLNTNSAWTSTNSGAYCYYDTVSANVDIYGMMYNWFAVNTGKLAPAGWRVPTEADWATLANTLGGDTIAGGKLKETGTTHWLAPNTGATNSSGYIALPGGFRHNYTGAFQSIGSRGCWWTATELNSTDAWYIGLYNNNDDMMKYHDRKEDGFSVRCIKN